MSQLYQCQYFLMLSSACYWEHRYNQLTSLYKAKMFTQFPFHSLVANLWNLKKKIIQLSIQRQGLILQIKLICPLFSSFTLSYDTVYLLTIMLWNTRFNYLISGLTQESMVMVVSNFFFFWMHSKLLIISECTFWLSYLVVWKKVADLPGDIFLAISFPSSI